MIKKTILLFFFFLFFVTYLFSNSLIRERFIIRNNSKETLIISHEFLCEYRYDYRGYPNNMHWIQKINDIDVEINNWLRDKEDVIKPRSYYFEVIYYLPSTWKTLDDFSYLFSLIQEMPFGEKMRAIFKNFSIRTEDGIYIIKDIEDLCNINVEKLNETTYLLEIYDE